jgi:hypothetical protein
MLIDINKYPNDLNKKDINNKNIYIYLFLFLLSFILINLLNIENSPISIIYLSPFYTYFYNNWFIDYYYFTDINSIGYSLYLGYPILVLIISIILFIVLILILKISKK